VIAVRSLEGDVNHDCAVNVADEALISSHYFRSDGMVGYDPALDIGAALPDGDIALNDLQFVFGREGSTCGAASPAQPPPATAAIVDTDADGVPDFVDNCAAVANADQPNTDGAWSNGPGVPGDDGTVGNGDALGNACDPDSDNDGLLDADELVGTGCGGVTTAVSADNTYGGILSPPPGGTSWDTDGDTVPDGVECALGTNPTVGAAADRTACSASLTNPNGDDDADGLSNVWEKCKWGSSNTVTNTDGDALGDCIEVMDVNGNGLMNTSDSTVVKQAAFSIIVGDLAAMDISGNGLVNASDATLILQKVFGATCL
jgi:hypothetical protein